MQKEAIETIRVKTGINLVFHRSKSLAALSAALMLAMSGAELLRADTGSGPNPSSPTSSTQNVNVVNTPTVNVGSLPVVTIGGTPAVHVANTSAAPAVISAIDDPGRVAYQSQKSVTLASPQINFGVQFPAVPANHRLVLQHIAVGVAMSVAGPVSVGSLYSSNFFIPAGSFVNLGFATFGSFDEPMLEYVDAGIMPFISIAAFNGGTFAGSGGLQQTVSLTGYMLDCSAAPCAPIAH